MPRFCPHPVRERALRPRSSRSSTTSPRPRSGCRAAPASTSCPTGANDVGTQLKYHYDDGRRTGSMDGQIIAREPDRHFAMKFTDKMMDVTVDFVAASDGVGTTLTHASTSPPRGSARSSRR